MSDRLTALLAAMLEDEDEQRRRFQLSQTNIVQAEPEPEPGDPIGDALRADVVAYWTMNEASGTREDSKGSNDLSSIANVASAAGKVGNAADLTYSVNHLEIADNADLRTGDFSFTYALWFRPTSEIVQTGQGVLVSKDDEVDQEISMVVGLSETPTQSIAAFGTYSGGAYPVVQSEHSIVAPDTWTFIMAGYDAAQGKLFIQLNDGTASFADAAAPTPLTGGKFFVGAQYDSPEFDGLIDEVGFWKRLLTSEEKSYLYNSGEGRTLYP